MGKFKGVYGVIFLLASGNAFAGVICEQPPLGAPVTTVVTGVDVDVDFPPNPGVSVDIDTINLTPCTGITGTLTTDNNDIDTGTGSVISSGVSTGTVQANQVNTAGVTATGTVSGAILSGPLVLTNEVIVSASGAGVDILGGGLQVSDNGAPGGVSANFGGNVRIENDLAVTNVNASDTVSAPTGEFDNLNVGSLTSDTVTVNTGNFQTVNANTGNFSTVNSKVGNIETVNSSLINTSVLDATTVNADAVNAQSVNAATVTAGSITAGSIAAGSINAGSVSAGTVNASRINAGTVNASGVIRAGGGFDAGGNKVRNVADGMAPSDAVNLRQLNVVQDQLTRQLVDTAEAAYDGIAGATALASIPAPLPGKASSLGLGIGGFRGREAVAMGGSFIIPNTPLQVKVGASLTGDHKNIGAGLGWSF